MLHFFLRYSFETWKMLNLFFFIKFKTSPSTDESQYSSCMFTPGMLCEKYGHCHLHVNSATSQNVFFLFFYNKTNFRIKLRFLRLKQTKNKLLFCVFLTSLFRREATASHHLLNSPIR